MNDSNGSALQGAQIVLLEHPRNPTARAGLARLLDQGARVVLAIGSSTGTRAAQAEHPRLEVLELADTRDWRLVGAALKRLSDKPDAVLSFSHHFCVVAARSAAELRTNGFDAPALELAADKRSIRDALAGSASALRYWTISPQEDLAGSAAQINLPAVVKPTGETSSTNVALVANLDDLYRAIAEIRGTRRNRKGFAQNGAVLVEQYANGPEFSVETMTWGGATTIYGVTIKTPLATHPFIEQADSFPCNDRAVVVALEAAAADVIARLPGFSGPAHLEMRLTSSGPKLIEINARQPGGFLPALVHWTTGRDIFLDTVCGLVGVEAPISEPVARAATWWQIYPPRAGRVVRCHIPESVRHAAGVMHADLTASPGDVVHIPRDNHGRIGDLLVCADATDASLERAFRLGQEITLDVAGV
jgi:biotin carboxylase